MMNTTINTCFTVFEGKTNKQKNLDVTAMLMRANGDMR